MRAAKIEPEKDNPVPGDLASTGGDTPVAKEKNEWKDVLTPLDVRPHHPYTRM